MDRIYMNHRPGEERIHVELTSSEVSDLLDDLQADPEHFDATRLFLGILRNAEEIFAPTVAEGRRDRAARTASGQQPETEPLRPRAERCPEPECTDEQQCWRCDYEESQHAARRPAPAVGQPAEAQATDRAAVLREAADAIDAEAATGNLNAPEYGSHENVLDASALLRRMAEEARS